MKTVKILSALRLDDFDPDWHIEAQRSRQWPDHAIIPEKLHSGAPNPSWAGAKYKVVAEAGEFKLAER